MALVERINEKATRNNARGVLSEYRSLKRRVSGSVIDPYSLIKSQEITDMPMHHSNQNGVEKTVIHKLRFVRPSAEKSKKEAENRIKIACIDRALSALSDISREVLQLTYTNPNKYTRSQIARKLEIYSENEYGEHEVHFYSVQGIQVLRDRALIEFAEAYSDPYGTELIEFELLEN